MITRKEEIYWNKKRLNIRSKNIIMGALMVVAKAIKKYNWLSMITTTNSPWNQQRKLHHISKILNKMVHLIGI